MKTENHKGKLYIVATPIGNIEDITIRAQKVLREVKLILAEDTRQTKKLLQHYQIFDKKLISYHEHSSQTKTDQIIEQLLNNNEIALVSSAGTPLIMDPGFDLVRKALIENIEIVSVPGASSLIAALSVVGIYGNTFMFHGFAPSSKFAKVKFFKQIANNYQTNVIFESKHKILDSLNILSRVYFEKIFLLKEITKLHEKVLYDTPSQLFIKLTEDLMLRKGEFILIIENKRAKKSNKILENISNSHEELLFTHDKSLKMNDDDFIKIIKNIKKVKLAKLLSRAFAMNTKDFLKLFDKKNR